MKILHTADWHLGKKLEKFSRLEEQRAVLEEICQIADKEEVDVVLIAGDLFDTFNPPTEAVELFYLTVKKLAANGDRAVIAIAGNHDSADRIEAPDPLARACGIILAGYPQSKVPLFSLDSGLAVTKSEPGFLELRLPDTEQPLRLINTPYANEFRLQTFLGLEDEEEALRSLLERHWQQLADDHCDSEGVNLLMTHLFMVKRGTKPPEEPESEKPILHVGGAQAVFTENLPPQIQYAALGHLHRYQVMDELPCPVVYPGSPLSYSFAEAGQVKQVVILEATPAQPVNIRPIPLGSGKDLIRKRFTSIDEAVSWCSQHPNALLELTIVSDQYLTAADRKRLTNAHSGIVNIIPEITDPRLLQKTGSRIDLYQDMIDLFREYFEFRQNQPPNDEILALFSEIRAESKEE